jgi:preprotein translocase subunit YajC
MDVIFTLTIILIIIAGYWSLTVFPKQRDYKKHVKYVKTLQEGDEVITYGGIIGTIVAFEDEYGTARLKIAEGVEVRIITAALRQHFDSEEVARNIRMAQGESVDVVVKE